MTAPRASETTHASCVALRGAGALITGKSGAGKSRLALELMALGADLVSDDWVVLRREGEAVMASAPPALAGLVEARGVGLLHADHIPAAHVRVIVDLDLDEPERLPPLRARDLLGVALPLIHGRGLPGLAAALAALLKTGGVRRAP